MTGFLWVRLNTAKSLGAKAAHEAPGREMPAPDGGRYTTLRDSPQVK